MEEYLRVFPHAGFFVFHQVGESTMRTDDLNGAIRQPLDQEVPSSATSERVLTVDELVQQFCVSRKTVSRWRRWG